MDEQAFALLIEPYRRALHLHCYRMLGSLHDADDAVQETMLRAWKSSDRYEPRAQLATWLHAIATNVCLTAIARTRKRPAEVIEDLEHLQPYPDRLLDDLVERETIELAFITAIQLLSPKPRAVLIRATCSAGRLRRPPTCSTTRSPQSPAPSSAHAPAWKRGADTSPYRTRRSAQSYNGS